VGLLYENKEEIEKIGKIIDFVKEYAMDRIMYQGEYIGHYYTDGEFNYMVSNRDWCEWSPDILYIEEVDSKDAYNTFEAYKKWDDVILVNNKIDINERYVELFA
jgi:hypothetical protein